MHNLIDHDKHCCEARFLAKVTPYIKEKVRDSKNVIRKEVHTEKLIG